MSDDLEPTEIARSARARLELLLGDHPSIAQRMEPIHLERLERFVVLLLEANRRLNLTRVVGAADVARLHLLDALIALPLLERLEPRSVVDIGSGGGLPAIPLAITLPHVQWALVESVGKKAVVLTEFARELELRNVTVIRQRAELLGREAGHRERYDLATARACAPLPVLVELALPLVRPGGTLVAWKGPLTAANDELTGGRVAAEQLGADRISLEDTGSASLGGHRFVLVAKASVTPARFPRRPGEAFRRPLG